MPKIKDIFKGIFRKNKKKTKDIIHENSISSREQSDGFSSSDLSGQNLIFKSVDGYSGPSENASSEKQSDGSSSFELKQKIISQSVIDGYNLSSENVSSGEQSDDSSSFELKQRIISQSQIDGYSGSSENVSQTPSEEENISYNSLFNKNASQTPSEKQNISYDSVSDQSQSHNIALFGESLENALTGKQSYNVFYDAESQDGDGKPLYELYDAQNSSFTSASRDNAAVLDSNSISTTKIKNKKSVKELENSESEFEIINTEDVIKETQKLSSSAQEYNKEIDKVVQGYRDNNNGACLNDILLKTGLVKEEELEKFELNDPGIFELAKKNANKKLLNTLGGLKDINDIDIDKTLSELIQTCNAHTSLKSGVAEFKLDKKLKVFNYSGDTEPTPEASVIMRDARLQDFINNNTNLFKPPLLRKPAHVADTYIANMAGTARGAIALIDKSDMSEEEKKTAKEECITLLKKKSQKVIAINNNTVQSEVKYDNAGFGRPDFRPFNERDYGNIETLREQFSENAAKEVQNFNDLLLKNLKVYKKSGALTINKKNFKSDEKLKEAISAARDCAMMNTSEDHCHVVTIHKTIGKEGNKKNGFSFSAIADPIPEGLRKDYKAIKNVDICNKELEDFLKKSSEGKTSKEELEKIFENFDVRFLQTKYRKALSKLPKWYKDKTPIEQKMIADNIDNYLSGRCVLSSQDRTVGGVVNYYIQREGVLDNEGKIDKSKNIIIQRGTFGDRQTKYSYPDNVKQNIQHMTRVAKKVIFQNVATNSLIGKKFGKKKENIMHDSVKNAVDDINGSNHEYQQNGLNTLSLVTSFFRRGKAIKNIIKSVNFQDKSIEQSLKNSNQETTQSLEEQQDQLVSMFCMSSKDRTSMGIMTVVTESFWESDEDKKEYAQAIIDSGHNQTLASRQGGTPGVCALKLADSLKSVQGLGAIGELLKKSVDANEELSKLNKFETKKKGVVKKLKNFLGLGKDYMQALDDIKTDITNQNNSIKSYDQNNNSVKKDKKKEHTIALKN